MQQSPPKHEAISTFAHHQLLLSDAVSYAMEHLQFLKRTTRSHSRATGLQYTQGGAEEHGRLEPLSMAASRHSRAQAASVQVLLAQVRPISHLSPLSQQGRPWMPQGSSLEAENVAAPPLPKFLPLAVRLTLRGLKVSAHLNRAHQHITAPHAHGA